MREAAPKLDIDTANPGGEICPAASRINRSEFVLHVVFLGLASAVLLMSFLMRGEGEQLVFWPGITSPLPMMCSTRLVFGIECPGCGLTRAFISISHGQFARAWHFHHASFFVYGFVAAQIPWQLFQLQRLWRGKSPWETSLVYLAPIGLALLLVVHWLFRLAGF